MPNRLLVTMAVAAAMVCAVPVQATDIQGHAGQRQLQDMAAYRPGAVHRFAIRNKGGLCLDVHAPDMQKDGGRVQVWQCNGEPQQRWIWQDGAIVNWEGKCLDVHAPDMRLDGGRIQVWECNGQPQQRWTLANGAIVNAAGKCLDVHLPDIRRNGGRVQIWSCNGETQQSWNAASAAIPRDRLAAEIAIAEGEMSRGADGAETANIELQQQMQKTQQRMQMLSNIQKKRRESQQGVTGNMK